MAQEHLDRLTSMDASFLHQEGPAAHMHIGGVAVFDGPAPSFEEILNHIRGRLHLVPRYRQKLATPPLDTGRQLWVDDTEFELENHVRRARLPAPGRWEQLLELVAKLDSQPLDRRLPLWEFWFVRGIEPETGSDVERFAFVSKNHHALVDGISGVDLAAVLFDLSPEPARLPTDGLRPWRAQPAPGPLELAAAGLRGVVNGWARMAADALASAARPQRTVGLLRDTAQGLGEVARAVLSPAPETPLNVPIGPRRRFATLSQPLADYKTVKNRFGGTVNDVMLATVAGALGRWLEARGYHTDGVELRALVPVSVRTADQRGTFGNRLTVMRAPLPVYEGDPVTRLGIVSSAMAGLKESKQAVGAATLVAAGDRLPPTVLAQASRLQFSTRLFNLLVTNVPGPQLPLYVLGRRLRHLFPLAFLPENNALAVAIISYDGLVDYGLLGDHEALPDIDLIARAIAEELAELVDAAENGAVSAGVHLGAAGGRPRTGPAADMRTAARSKKNLRMRI
ncbi:MAG TPA: wax ester/triacylglycerol synthase family O-acyltransferase [Solirubrobacteraceae bacterium]|nr:wax ester/triacylglycerol synthase family O-acyltransferase [Solirubrobacteraceae bacterium]